MLTKKAVHAACVAILEDRLGLLQSEMRSLHDSSEEETKSSAGDKYETTREMIQAEKEKLAGRMEETTKFQHIISSIQPSETSSTVQSGSLVRTESGWLYLSASLGTVEVNGQKIFVISPIAPIGQAMLGKKEGQTFSLNGKSQTIQILL
jgi:transcription elongation GreA/GreB family factor